MKSPYIELGQLCIHVLHWPASVLSTQPFAQSSVKTISCRVYAVPQTPHLQEKNCFFNLQKPVRHLPWYQRGGMVSSAHWLFHTRGFWMRNKTQQIPPVRFRNCTSGFGRMSVSSEPSVGPSFSLGVCSPAAWSPALAAQPYRASEAHLLGELPLFTRASQISPPIIMSSDND